jgi:hypothetical protein
MKLGNGTDRWNSLVYVGKGGGGSTGPLGFMKSSDNTFGNGPTNQRDLVTFYDQDGPKTIRKFLTYRHTRTGEQMFAVQLADFSPSFSSTTTPGASLEWDVACTGFRVSVDNPTDFTEQYISSVHSVVPTHGTVSKLEEFTAGPRTPTPGGGIDWTQTFTTNATGVIRPISGTIEGGSAAANIRYNSFSGSESLFTASNSTISVSWATPGLGIITNPLSNKTFLETYTTTNYAILVSGLSDSANRVHTVSTSTGTVSNLRGDGTFTFTTPIHKDNTSTPRTVSASTIFTRPAAVTGTSYSVPLNATTSVSVYFSYPTFWLFTAGTTSPPVLSNIISGSGFAAGVTVLGDQAHTFGGLVENPSLSPSAFWFCVKNDIPQPTVFKTGKGAGLMSDVSAAKGNTVSLEPDSKPNGYSAVSYALYGITVQSGETYISIT